MTLKLFAVQVDYSGLFRFRVDYLGIDLNYNGITWINNITPNYENYKWITLVYICLLFWIISRLS